MALNLTCCFPKVGCCFLCCLAENCSMEPNPETPRVAGTVANERAHTSTSQISCFEQFITVFCAPFGCVATI